MGTRGAQQLGTEIRQCLCSKHTYPQQHHQRSAGCIQTNATYLTAATSSPHLAVPSYEPLNPSLPPCCWGRSLGEDVWLFQLHASL